MKIGIITYHFPYNCGAVLQCFALQTKLEELGHEVCVINYRPWYHQNRYTPLKNPIYFANKRFHDPAGNFLKRCYHAFDGFARTVHSWKTYPQAAQKEKKFSAFVKKYLNETKVYRSLKALQEEPPLCDMYISGSDQLWNCAITNGTFDAAYFLDFGNEKTGRMTYSVGADFSRMEHPEDALKELVKKLDVISLRESKWLPQVEKAAEGKIDTHIDVDPTLLLDVKKYERYMAKLKREEPYILTYTMMGEAQSKVYDCAKFLSKKLGLKIIDVSGDPNKENKNIKDNRLCGPDEFLWYVNQAEYVVTNSFHGTVFSVLFHKKFVTIPHAVTGNRVTELLDKLGLSNRYCYTASEAITEITNNIDYAQVSNKLEMIRNNSIGFLQSSIEQYSRKEG